MEIGLAEVILILLSHYPIEISNWLFNTLFKLLFTKIDPPVDLYPLPLPALGQEGPQQLAWAPSITISKGWILQSTSH